MLTRREAKVLLAAAAWTFYVWVSRIVIMAGQDESAGFKAVHLVLALVSLGFGAFIARIGLRSLRAHQTREPKETTRV
ncbi:MAG TPA: hypothetical protein VI854_08845 [Acidimicrobiia bacterium]|nr:hypothetical protein [Acidimicrobiia bacterium]